MLNFPKFWERRSRGVQSQIEERRSCCAPNYLQERRSLCFHKFVSGVQNAVLRSCFLGHLRSFSVNKTERCVPQLFWERRSRGVLNIFQERRSHFFLDFGSGVQNAVLGSAVL